MFDIGFGELLLLAAGALLIFGPDRLPRSAADFAKTVRRVQAMAKNARQSIVDVAGADLVEGKEALQGIADLHPRKLLSSMLNDEGDGAQPPASGIARMPSGYVRAAEARKALQPDPDPAPGGSVG